MSPHPSLMPRFRRAANLRAAGHTWESAAAAVKCRVDTVRKWVTAYPAAWRAAFAAGRKAVLEEAAAEAVCVLRQQLRAPEDKTKLDAARKLIDCAEPGADAPADETATPYAGLFAHLEGLSDDQLDDLLAQFRDQLEAGRRGGVDAGPGAESAA